jgi:hypothetical protein
MTGWARAVAVGLFGVSSMTGLAACSDDDAGAGDTGAGDAGTSELPSDAELEAGLLSIDEFPVGWAEEPQSEDDEDSLCGFELTDVLELEEDSLPSASLAFAEDPDLGPLFGETIGFVPEGRGAEALDLTAEELDGCEDDFQGEPATITALSFPEVGDESIAYRISVGAEDEVGVEIAIVYARVEDLLLALVAVDVLGDPVPTLEAYAQLAVDKAAAELL